MIESARNNPVAKSPAILSEYPAGNIEQRKGEDTMKQLLSRGALCAVAIFLIVGAFPCQATDRFELLLDINPSSASSSPWRLTRLGEKIYFSADDGIHGKELWETAVGTRMLTNLPDGTDPAGPGGLTACGSYLYYTLSGVDTNPNTGLFSLNSATGATERIWRYKPDGVYAGGTRLFFRGVSLSSPHLCATDGTVASVTETALSFPKPESTIAIGNVLYFQASQGFSTELWRSDGTDAGSWKVSDVYPSSLANLGGVLLYSGWDGGATGQELWRSDGTPGGTYLVKDIRPGNPSSYVMNLRVAGDYLYFTANDGQHGMELWRSDGTADGTVLVRDICPGSAYWGIKPLADFAGCLFFFVETDGPNLELWKSDGSEAGTVKVRTLLEPSNYPSPYLVESVSANGLLYIAFSSTQAGLKLWKCDGTTAGTLIAREFASVSTYYDPYLTALGNRLVFTANDGALGQELWIMSPVSERQTGAEESWHKYR
jgi:ELWxxDGT repeat protein